MEGGGGEGEGGGLAGKGEAFDISPPCTLDAAMTCSFPTFARLTTAAQRLSRASNLIFHSAVMGTGGGEWPGSSSGSSSAVERQAETSGAVRSGRRARKRPNASNARAS